MSDELVSHQRLLSNTGLHIADWQLKTINVWPKLFFPESTKHKVIVDQDEQTITFVLTLPPKMNIEKPQLLFRLDQSVQKLFGASWSTVIKRGRTVIYRGTRLQELPKEDTNPLSGFNPNAKVTIKRMP
jgi:hypothetical protein